MEKIPSFIYDLSKKESSAQRQELAQEVKRKRAEYFNKKKTLEEQKKGLEENIDKKEQETTEKLAKIEFLKKEIEDLSKSGVKKFFNYFKLKKL
jgi:chromosome segregation ATPase